MSSQEFVGGAANNNTQERVVEYEIKMPGAEDIKLPEVNLEPVRVFAEKALIVGIGAGVLLARGVASAVRAAAAAGEKEAENPGPVAKAILGVVGRKEQAKTAETKPLRLQVLPIDGYDDLSDEQIIERLGELSRDDLEAVREYEIVNRAREEVMAAIDNLMGAE